MLADNLLNLGRHPFPLPGSFGRQRTDSNIKENVCVIG